MVPALRRFGVDLHVHTVSGNDSGEGVVDLSGRRCLVLGAGDWRGNSPWLLATVGTTHLRDQPARPPDAIRPTAERADPRHVR